MHLTAQVLKELIDDSRGAASASELLERAVRHLSALEGSAALVVHQPGDPHRVRARATRGFAPDLVDVLAANLPLGLGRVKAAWPEAPVNDDAVFYALALEGKQEQVTMICDGVCADETLSLVTSFVALALDREAAVAGAQHLADLFTAGPLVVFSWRNAPGWPVEYVSPNVTKEFGFQREALLGKPYAPFVHPDDVARVGGEVQDALARGDTYFEQQYRVFDAQGRARDIYDFTHVIRAPNGEATHFHGYVFDDGQRVRAERARAELTVQLQQSQKLQAVGTLASGVAHDFNNVLAAILAHLELARLDPGVNANADVVAAAKSALRGRDIVRQLLVFSRARVEERRPWRLQQVIEDSMGMMRSSIPSTIGLRFSLDPRTPAVLADATQLQQVLVNLVNNAAQAMPRGGTVDVSVSPAPGEPPRAQLEVRDHGEGMPPGVLERAFEPFFTTKPVGQGTGLGLSMVHSIVTAHGGGITLDSKPGAGTTATVTLPGATEVATAQPPAPVTPAPGAQQHVALVEDEPLVARATERLVAHLGYRVTVHADAQGVLEAFAKDPHAYDLVLTDQTMPAMTGLDLGQALRARGHRVPVLLVTGLPTQIDADAVTAPFLVLGKPYRSEELATGLAQLLTEARGTG